MDEEELNRVVVELVPVLVGARVENVHDSGECAWVLTLRAPAKNHLLLMSCFERLARLHALEHRPPAPPSPTPFCQLLRSHLHGLRLESLRQVRDDRLVESVFTGRHTRQLLHQLFGRRPNLILLDGEGKLLASLAPVRQGGVILQTGSFYDPAASALRCPARRRRVRAACDVRPKEGPENDSLDWNRRLARQYAQEEQEFLLLLRRDSLLRQLRKDRKRCHRTRAKVEADLARAEQREHDRKLGELLKGAFPALRRGLAQVEVVDYFDPALPAISIRLDPALSPQENVERYFKSYRKAQRARSALTARLGVLAAEEERLALSEERINAADSIAALDELVQGTALEARTGRAARRRGGPARARPGGTTEFGPRRFRVSGGYLVLVGRSARQNDQLTSRLARGNDVFLHVAGRPGAHVILRREADKDVPHEALLDAAQLALYYSYAARSRSMREGVSADVDYAPAKYVRKPRGSKPGAVLLARHKTLRVGLETERLERIFKGRGGSGTGSASE